MFCKYHKGEKNSGKDGTIFTYKEGFEELS